MVGVYVLRICSRGVTGGEASAAARPAWAFWMASASLAGTVVAVLVALAPPSEMRIYGSGQDSIAYLVEPRTVI